MRLVHRFRARLRALIRRDAADRELAEEIQHHIALETEKNVRCGMSPTEARRAALVQFGGVQRVREEHRDIRRLRWIEDFATDARFALRSLRRTPGLAGAAVITLTLGIAANVAIFSAVNAVLLRPLPFPDRDRLVIIGEDNPETGLRFDDTTPANFLVRRCRVPAGGDGHGCVVAAGVAGESCRPDALAQVGLSRMSFRAKAARSAAGVEESRSSR